MSVLPLKIDDNQDPAQMVSGVDLIDSSLIPPLELFGLGQPEIIEQVKGATSTSNTTSHAITMPSNIAAGDLLIIFFSVDGSPWSYLPGWNKGGEENQSNDVAGCVFWKIAEGGDTATVLTNQSEQSSHIVFQLRLFPGWSGPLVVGASNNSSNSNPPSLSLGADAKSGLVIASRHGDSTTVATVAPSGYTGLNGQEAGGSAGASTNTAYKYITDQTSEDPGTFTSGIRPWVAFTVFIPDIFWDLGTSQRTAAVGANDAGFGSIAWSNPTNAQVPDSSAATATMSGTADTNWLKTTDYGFEIHPDATINHMRVRWTGASTGGTTGGINLSYLGFTYNGTTLGNNFSNGTGAEGGFRLHHREQITSPDNHDPVEVTDTTFGVLLAYDGNKAGTDRIINVDSVEVLVQWERRRSILPYVSDAQLTTPSTNETALLTMLKQTRDAFIAFGLMEDE